MQKENFQDLANAIIIQAVKDYRMVRKILKRHPRNAIAKNAIMDIEKFFLSDWFKDLTTISGTRLKEKLRKEG